MNVYSRLLSVRRRASVVSQTLRNTILSRAWPPYSRLCLVSDGANWVLSWEMRALEKLARRLGLRVTSAVYVPGVRRQAVFYADQFCLFNKGLFTGGNRIGFCYYHGRPSPLEPQFEVCYRTLAQHHDQIQRLQVTNTVFRDFVLETGMNPEKVFIIPISIDLSWFQLQTLESRRKARSAYNLPQSAVIVGSIQKDGVGWGDGMEPKLIKGPDIFVKTIELLKPRIPDLFVLVCGPARGYVVSRLEKLGVPHRYIPWIPYPKVGQIFAALDLYLVTAREEGGPKAVLESMASGVPLVTTRVGQAVDLVQHGTNGWMVDVGDVEGLAHWAQYAIEHRTDLDSVLRNARKTAEANDYDAQTPLWQNFFHGFVEAP